MATQHPHTRTRTRDGRRRFMIGIVTTVALAVLGIGVAATATGCDEEDGSTNFACHWDGEARGNRAGAYYLSFAYGRLVVPLS